MPSQDVAEKICRVKEALNTKGFEGIYATHYDNTPSGLLVLHDDHGRVAHGEDAAIIRVIEDSDDEAGLWSSLEESGMIRADAAIRA